MSKVTRLRHALPMSLDINAAVADLDKAIADAVDAAKAAGLPQGLSLDCSTVTPMPRHTRW